jgi:hypothetical protein
MKTPRKIKKGGPRNTWRGDGPREDCLGRGGLKDVAEDLLILRA